MDGQNSMKFSALFDLFFSRLGRRLVKFVLHQILVNYAIETWSYWRIEISFYHAVSGTVTNIFIFDNERNQIIFS